jgi:uncharacterized protein (UPF0335 family)
MSLVGHNSLGGDALRHVVERVERLIEERKGINDDIRDVLRGAKAQGFDVKTIRQVIRFRAMDPDVLNEKRALEQTYAHALGMDLV